MEKKKICLLTNWYPTKDNPYQGSFFKEQAFAVADSFDFIVVHYIDTIRKNPFKKYTISEDNREKNTIEYTIKSYVPIWIYLSDIWEAFRKTIHPEERVEGIGKYVSESRKKFTKNTIVKAFERINQSVDAFYCVDAQQDAYYIQCLADYYHKPYIVGEHAPVPWPGSRISDINKYAIEKADVFFAISNDKIRQMLMQNIKLPPVVYLGNLIDENQLLIQHGDRIEKTLIIVAAHSFYKNYDMFISVINKVTELTDAKFKVIIVGYGSNQGYSKGIEEFEKQISESKFAQFVEMIPSVPHEEIGTVLNRADAFVMTSIQEGQPVSAMEAACCGLPIFSTRCGGVEDYVDERCGRIFGLMDIDDFALSLVDFIEGRISFDPWYIRDSVVKRFGTEAFSKIFVDTFLTAINNAQHIDC